MKVLPSLLRACRWHQPEGYKTGINVYNCIAKDKVPLIVRNKNFVSWYTCGPTVYDSAHLGHASCYVKLDIIQRILRKHFGLNVVTAMNVTDIDDKIIQKANSLNVSCESLACQYEKEFWNDLQSLNVSLPNIVLKVTDHIPLILSFIKQLVDKKYAYVSNGSVYFNVEQYPSYNKLVSVESESIGKPLGEKLSDKDFALWKHSTDKSGSSWESEWGRGRPGWHIECSALASSVYGSVVDIHAGGIDLRFPHHENEEAQSCCYHETPQWVNYWLHAGHLMDQDSVKMSKSLQNGITVQNLLSSFHPNVFRMACLMTTYRQPMKYSEELLKSADGTLKKITSCINTCNEYLNGFIPNANVDENVLIASLNECSENVTNALKDDFDTATVVKSLFSLINVLNKMLHSEPNFGSNNINASVLACKSFLKELMDTFGFTVGNIQYVDDVPLHEVLDLLTSFRQNIRLNALKHKDSEMLLLCDKLRNDLTNINIVIKDHGKNSSWNK